MTEPYDIRRKRIYDSLREEGIFTWDECYGEEYALATVQPIPAAWKKELDRATEALGRVFSRVIPVVQQADDELLRELGIPAAAIPAVRIALDPLLPTVVGRFDFARTPEGWKMLEFNGDTPTGVVEAFYVNGRVVEALNAGSDPNEGADSQIWDAFQRAVQVYREDGRPIRSIVFSSLDWHEEDAGTTRYLMKRSGLNARFVPLEHLRVEGDRLGSRVEGHWKPIDLWYRLHALEILAEEADEDGYPTGAHVLDLIRRGRLSTINPPGALIGQTKALQALIWSLHETGQFFTPDEHRLIHQYLLPTYLENRFLGREPHVVKPVLGREGGAVLLCDADGWVTHRDQEAAYWNQPMVYQRRVELDQVEVETLEGRRIGNRLWGSFLVGGEASAILCRVDGPITGNLARFLPVAISD
ncbi:glutathionylspermidine synthase family protein [Desmospora profundinema]|uniref:Glutathionylspermidine synthase n=1 Tax=Desmospora profundinema TaxID=1571184 RepID=A0ABU1ILH8_9BACL|nr:glutathionylspermidine synthase family protein [Desmospora profundinema]MDR6225593.1 glutathionylspermidine synthase [Desmospora profundinema]